MSSRENREWRTLTVRWLVSQSWTGYASREGSKIDKTE
jgi:hypothetical protein